MATTLRTYAEQGGSSARVLLTTVFGDIVAPRDAPVPVRSLVTLMAPFGVNERGVRTALLRLSREGLLASERVGRQSYYRVAGDAARTFADADRRIYHRQLAPWDGCWTIVVLDPRDDAETRARVGRRLGWAGFGPVGADTHLSPTVAPTVVADLLAREGASAALVTRAESLPGPSLDPASLASLVMPLEERRQAHLDHQTMLAPLRTVASQLDGVDAYVVRTLVVDAWRRVLLRDVELPAPLLPEAWPGDAAYELSAELYRSTREAADVWLDEILGSPRPGDDHPSSRRFAGGS